MARERLIYIDNLKGFAILLVIIGHIIQCMYAPQSYKDNYIFQCIYSFHMPLFMMLSGLTFTSLAGVSRKNYLQKISKRFTQLIIPFCVWGIITTNTSSISPYFKIFIYPDLSLWFLYILFWVYLFCSLACWLSDRHFHLHHAIPVISMYLILTLLRFGFSENQLIGMISTNYLYYGVGVLFGGGNLMKLSEKTPMPIVFISLFGFIVAGCVWQSLSIPLPHNLVHFVVALWGSLTFMLFFARIVNTSKTKLAEFGKITLGVYAIHPTLMWCINQYCPQSLIDFNQTILGFVLSLISTIVLTLTVRQILLQTKITSLLFLGENRY